jgi:hypothetical protein
MIVIAFFRFGVVGLEFDLVTKLPKENLSKNKSDVLLLTISLCFQAALCPMLEEGKTTPFRFHQTKMTNTQTHTEASDATELFTNHEGR